MKTIDEMNKDDVITELKKLDGVDFHVRDRVDVLKALLKEHLPEETKTEPVEQGEEQELPVSNPAANTVVEGDLLVSGDREFLKNPVSGIVFEATPRLKTVKGLVRSSFDEYKRFKGIK